MTHRDSAHALFWSWIGRVFIWVIVWTSIGFIFALPQMNTPGGWRQVLLPPLAFWWCWGFLALLIVATDLRLPFSGAQFPRRIAAHLPLSILYTSLLVYVVASVRALLGLEKWTTLSDPHLLSKALHGMFLWNWLIYWVIVGAWQAYRYYQRYLASELRRERLERQFSEARLNALRMQLNPHFLFNALNTISSQVESDPRLARRMIEHLGDLLRLSLEAKDKQEVSLAEEIDFLEHYLVIQKIRFGEHLKIDLAIAAEVKPVAVPSLFLLPGTES